MRKKKKNRTIYNVRDCVVIATSTQANADVDA